MAGNGSGKGSTTVALDCCYRFSINNTISISTVGNSLEMTSYCMDTECFERRQRAEIEIIVTMMDNNIFTIISPPLSSSIKKFDFKVSNLYFKLHFNQYNMIRNIYSFHQNGIVNVEMVNCGIISYRNQALPWKKIDFLYLLSIDNWPDTGFETIVIQNVTIENKPLSYSKETKSFLKETILKTTKSNNNDTNNNSVHQETTTMRNRLQPNHFSSKRKYKTLRTSANITIIGSSFKNFGIILTISSFNHRSLLNFFMYQNILNESSLYIDCNDECHIRIDSHRHFASPTSLILKRHDVKNTIRITNTTSTGQITRYNKGSIYVLTVLRAQFVIESSEMVDCFVEINNCVLGDLIIVGLRIINVGQVYILNTKFHNIQVNSQDKVFSAGGLTAVSGFVHMENITFSNVSAESTVPSSLHVEFKSWLSKDILLKMINVLVETNNLQSWVDDVIWHLITDYPLSFQTERNNVTVRCFGGHQKIVNITSKFKESLYCIRCNTSSYNVQTPAFVWKKASELVEVNNTCHDHCPYQASCIEQLKSRGNYWGIVNNQSGIVEFYQCPPSYCCSSQRDCVSYNTCTNNRRGRLCGDCKADHSIALFDPNRCVPNDNCKHDLLWIPYVFAVLFVLITILYLKDIFSFIGKLLARMRNTNEELQRSMYREIPYLEPLIESNTMANESKEFFQQKTTSTSGRISGLIKLAFFFYQVASIIRIGSSAKANYQTPLFIELITSIFNIKLGSSTVSTNNNVIGRWCPLQTTNFLLTELLRNSIILWCLLFIISFLLFKRLFQYVTTKAFSPRISTTPASINVNRSFASITKICFESVHCIEINRKWFLYKQAATLECYQYGVFVIIAGWVVLFPFTLYIAVVKLRSKCLNPNEFLFTLLIPTSMILFLVRSCLRSNVNHGRQQHHGGKGDILGLF